MVFPTTTALIFCLAYSLPLPRPRTTFLFLALKRKLPSDFKTAANILLYGNQNHLKLSMPFQIPFIYTMPRTRAFLPYAGRLKQYLTALFLKLNLDILLFRCTKIGFIAYARIYNLLVQAYLIRKWSLIFLKKHFYCSGLS